MKAAKAETEKHKPPVGPFGVMDTVGLDTVYKITGFWTKKLQDPTALKNAEFMKRYVNQGRLGIKTGQGVYTYSDPGRARPDFLKLNYLTKVELTNSQTESVGGWRHTPLPPGFHQGRGRP